MCECVDDTVLCNNVVMAVTLYILICVCVGFLYTPVLSIPFTVGFTVMFKKGIAPSGLVSSTVNCMTFSTEFMCCRNLSLH